MTYHRKHPGRGAKDPRYPDHTQIIVRIDDETFQEIYDRACREGTSTSEQVRLLIEWGLEAEKGSAAS